MSRLMPRYSILLAAAVSLIGLAPATAQMQAPPPQTQPPPSQMQPPPQAQPPARPVGPCRAVRLTCEQAGFVRQGRRDGLGIVTDCIRPIMTGTPQRRRAARPLPPIDPALVAACRARNPNFGMPRPRNAQPPAPGAAPQMAPPPGAPNEQEETPQEEDPAPAPKR
jgi:hypothetical protein